MINLLIVGVIAMMIIAIVWAIIVFSFARSSHNEFMRNRRNRCSSQF